MALSAIGVKQMSAFNMVPFWDHFYSTCIYINDMLYLMEDGKICKYADDTTIYFVSDKIDAVVRRLEDGVAAILKGLCKAISLHLHRAEKSKNNPLKLIAHTCC